MGDNDGGTRETLAGAEDVDEMRITDSENVEHTFKERKPEIIETWSSYLVLLASFTGNFIVDGVVFSYGIILQDLKSYFMVDFSSLTLPSSLHLGVAVFAALLTGSFIDHFGIRLSGFIGGILFICGFTIASFASKLSTFTVGYGFTAGIGSSFLGVLPSAVIPFYFDRNRPIATGISLTGGSVGLFAMGPVIRYLLDRYTWRGCILILGGIILQEVWIWSFVGCLRNVQQENGTSRRKELNSNGTIHKILATLKATIRCRILTDFSFSLFLFALFLTHLTEIVLYVYTPDKGTGMGFSEDETKWFTSCLGIGTLVGRIVVGSIGNAPFRRRRRLKLHLIVVTVTGVGVSLLPVCRPLWSMYFILCVCGVATGALHVLAYVVAFDLSETESTTRIVSCVLLVKGMAFFISPLLAGLVRDNLDSYDMVFYLAGGYNFLAFLIMITVLAIRLRSTKCKNNIFSPDNGDPAMTLKFF